MFRIASRKLGIEPVVKAFIRGSVTVGGNACAVNGMARPELIWLTCKLRHHLRVPLNEIHC